MGIESKPQFKDAFKHIKGGSDELDGDKMDIDYNPSSYSPSTGATHEDVDHLASHLKGIDEQLTNLIDNANTGVTWALTGARNTNGGSDRDMANGGVLTNVTPYIIPYNCVLVKVVGSTAVNETWEAHVLKNNVSVTTLFISATSSQVSPELNISFVQGDEVRLRLVNGTGSINRPRITAFFKRV